MKIYPNIFAVIPDLPNMNEWLMVADDAWQKDPQTAKIYIFDEDEMYDLEEQGLAKIGEYFDEFPLPFEFENKPIGYLSESGTLEGIVYNLAKYLPNYSQNQLIEAINFYQEFDTFFEPKNIETTMNIWAIAVSPKQLGLLKDIEQSFTDKLNNPSGIIWIKSNKPISIVEMATCYGDGKFVNHDKFTNVLKELDFYDANAVCLLAEGSSEINFEQLTLSKDEKEYLIYLGKFDMVFNAQN